MNCKTCGTKPKKFIRVKCEDCGSEIIEEQTGLQLAGWAELAERLRLYATAVNHLGGMNDLGQALGMAADGLDLYAPKEGPSADCEPSPLRPKAVLTIVE